VEGRRRKSCSGEGLTCDRNRKYGDLRKKVTIRGGGPGFKIGIGRE